MISSSWTQVPPPPGPPPVPAEMPAEGFKAPGVEDFNLPPIFEGVPVLEWFDKPADRAEARRHLQLLRGRSHKLVSTVVAVMNGQRQWHHTDTATLTMRNLSDDFIDRYLDEMGDAVLSSVGAYQLEGLGAQLFNRIEGDYFTILGMPLLPVLDYLRLRRILAS